MVIIEEFEKGLLFERGRLVRVLEPGAYRWMWRLFLHRRVVKVDLRIRTLAISGQEMMTADKVTLRLNVLVKFRVMDPAAAVVKAESYTEQLYGDAQLAVRTEIAAQTLDELLAAKAALGPRVREALAPVVAEYGVAVVDIGLKDVVLPGEMKSILNQVIEAKKRAEAAMIERREEVAAIRSQVNTADLYARNPTLMRLKEMESVEKILGGADRTFVLGSPQDLWGALLKGNGGVGTGTGTGA